MQGKLTALTLVITLIFSTAIFATKAQYSVIIDAGSHGSRLHLFKYNNNNEMPVISDIFIEKNTKPLATFASHPEDAGPSLKKLLNAAAEKISDEKIKETVPISVLGTGGMRLIPEDQQQTIYDNIKYYISNKYKNIFVIDEVQSISGKMEGVYGWLDVNYLAETFQNKTTTLGSLDMGGSSTQIAFATDDHSMPLDETSLTVNNVHYTVYSKSFLGLGLDRARNSIFGDFTANSCYPTGYPFSDTMEGFFNLVSCALVYNKLIDKYKVFEQIIPLYNVPMFVAFSGAYRTYHFFGIDSHLSNQTTLEQQYINPVCSTTWNKMKKTYPDEEVGKLSNYCADSIYVTNLFFGVYRLQSKQLKILEKINEEEINWALGGLLYKLVT